MEDEGVDDVVDSAAACEVVETVVLRFTPSDVDDAVGVVIASSAAETCIILQQCHVFPHCAVYRHCVTRRDGVNE